MLFEENESIIILNEEEKNINDKIWNNYKWIIIIKRI